MPQSLQEKTLAGLSDEEKCDILLSLINRVDLGRPVGFDPAEILLDEDNLILDPPAQNEESRNPLMLPSESVRHVLTGGNAVEESRNLLMLPPELIRNVLAGGNAVMNAPQSWFLLGMIAYYMYYRTDYYAQNDVSILDIDRHIRQRTSVIQANEAQNIPFADAVAKMTAVSPAAREEGISAFLQYLPEHMPGTIRVRFLCDGRIVGERDVESMREDVEDLEPSGRILLNGVWYRPVTSPIRVLYRPGRHSLNVDLARLSPQGFKIKRTWR